MDIQSPGISIFSPTQTAVEPSLKAQKVAKDFESLFVSMMLKSMRDSVLRSDLVPENMGEKMYTEMLDQEYAGLITQNAGLGLSDLILKELQRQEGGAAGKNGLAEALSGLQGPQGYPWSTDNAIIAQSRGVDFDSVAQRVTKWDSIIQEASNQFGLDASLVSAVIAQESAGNPNAVSRAGAKGLMQLIDTTAQQMGVQRVYDPRENILGGSKYLRMMLDRFGGDKALALASYNAGPGAVERHQGIPPYIETRQYVQNVLGLEKQFAQSHTAQSKE
jgi:Rod binding domain-containing protein